MTLIITQVNADIVSLACKQLCEKLKDNVVLAEHCSQAIRTLPRPKVGSRCLHAAENGFNDACLSLCEGKEPQNLMRQACAKAATETPRPTILRFCETGYRLTFNLANKELRKAFTSLSDESTPDEHSEITQTTTLEDHADDVLNEDIQTSDIVTEQQEQLQQQSNGNATEN